jgi:hypothetical protein
MSLLSAGLRVGQTRNLHEAGREKNKWHAKTWNYIKTKLNVEAKLSAPTASREPVGYKKSVTGFCPRKRQDVQITKKGENARGCVVGRE